MPEAVVRELWTYPVKGCQGVSAETLAIEPRGIPGDRAFVLWHEGELVDQKETPRMAALAVAWDAGAGRLRFEHPEHGDFEHVARAEGPVREARWVLDRFETVDQGDEVAAWLSAVLEKPVRLVAPGAPWKIRFPIPQLALLDGREKQSFFAASPVSLANRASLEALNRRLAQPVPMDRFRMNVVVDGLEAHREDGISTLEGEQVRLRHVTSAERCAIVATDQRTGARPDVGLLRQLPRKPKAERFGSGRIFGTYLQVERPGSLRVGERLRVE